MHNFDYLIALCTRVSGRNQARERQCLNGRCIKYVYTYPDIEILVKRNPLASTRNRRRTSTTFARVLELVDTPLYNVINNLSAS